MPWVPSCLIIGFCAGTQANLLNDYLLPHERAEKKRAPKRKSKVALKADGDGDAEGGTATVRNIANHRARTGCKRA